MQSVSSPSQLQKNWTDLSAPAKSMVPPWLTIGVAILVLIGFGFFLDTLMDMVDSKAEEKEWSRAMALFSSVEALAFGAAGLLFGTTIEGRHTDQARQDAKVSQQKVQQAMESFGHAWESGIRLSAELEAVRDGVKNNDQDKIDAALSAAETAGKTFLDMD